MIAAEFLRNLIAAVPYKLTHILADNGIQFTNRKCDRYAFIMTYNFAQRLKTLKGLTPYEYACKIWTKQPERFNLDPFLHTVGLNAQNFAEKSCFFMDISYDHWRIVQLS